MKKVLITGSRDWIAPDQDHPNGMAQNAIYLSRRQAVREAIDNLELELNTLLSNILIIHGGAVGVDSLADELARELGCSVRAYPAEWDVYGQGAGPIRNRKMVDENPDIVMCLAFHDNIIASQRTLHACRYAKSKGIPVMVFRSDGSFHEFIMPVPGRFSR